MPATMSEPMNEQRKRRIRAIGMLGVALSLICGGEISHHHHSSQPKPPHVVVNSDPNQVGEFVGQTTGAVAANVACVSSGDMATCAGAAGVDIYYCSQHNNIDSTAVTPYVDHKKMRFLGSWYS